MNNIIAEALMLKYRQEMKNLEEKRKAFEKQMKDEEKSVYNIKNEAQKACTHPSYETRTHYNYHNNYEEYEDICDVCGKTVKWY